MKVFEANISFIVFEYFKNFFENTVSYEEANNIIFDGFGINTFFENLEDYQTLKESINQISKDEVDDRDKVEYGDYQTNKNLAFKVANLISDKNISPEIVLEPTCGKGNFIIAALNSFQSIKKVYAIEIFKPYVWETKFNIIEFYISNPEKIKPEISIIHQNVFDFDFKKISKQFPQSNWLIIGNPPWVTNSKLGSLNSSNLPTKRNIKNQNGLDAITGKGNFDIAESITLMLFDAFQYNYGHLAILVKNSVVKNIVFDQKDKQYRISNIEKYSIDSKKEFDVSVDASLLFCSLNSIASSNCLEFDFYTKNKKNSFGWHNLKFVSNVDEYNKTKNIDGICPFEWRQGIKHDCSNIMELERRNGHFINKLSEEINLEEDLIYGFLKSSDLKNTVINNSRKQVIVTQTKVGQETSYIKNLYPATYNYLKKNIASFQARKSSIYNRKPLFSIFGIGEYSFKPYKVAISSLYKTYHFTLVLPQNGKPVMLDDTCYFIGFDQIEYAVYALILLNYSKTAEFLKSITFSDSKRVFTKDLLMRLDLLSISNSIPQDEILEQINQINVKYNLNVGISLWESFINMMTLKEDKQISMFA